MASGVFTGSQQTDDLDAINEYMMKTKIKTKKAEALQVEWIKWFEPLSWYERTLDTDTFDVARNRRNAFNLANATSTKAKEQIREVIKNGTSGEEARGETRRSTAEGRYIEDAELEPPEPFFPTRVKVAAGLGLLAILAAMMAKKVYVDPILRLAKLG